jgi:tight adherence protein B
VNGRRTARRRLARLAAFDAPRRSWTVSAVLGRRSIIVLVAVTALAGGVAGALGGPVATVIAMGYAVLVLRTVRRAVAERAITAARTAALDVIGGLAADLRAGVMAGPAVDSARAALLRCGAAAPTRGAPDPAVQRALGRLSAACEVSDRLGAPLADLLDQVETDLRGVERARVAVAAQTSGARASAALLALLPLAGVGLGYAMGARPDHALLHTPFGAGCVLGALLLQCGGLGWVGRLCRAAVERAS